MYNYEGSDIACTRVYNCINHPRIFLYVCYTRRPGYRRHQTGQRSKDMVFRKLQVTVTTPINPIPCRVFPLMLAKPIPPLKVCNLFQWCRLLILLLLGVNSLCVDKVTGSYIFNVCIGTLELKLYKVWAIHKLFRSQAKNINVIPMKGMLLRIWK